MAIIFKDDFSFEVTQQNAAIITLQLFNIDVSHMRQEYAPLAMPLMEQLIEDWYQYTASPAKSQPLIKTVKVFLDALLPSVKKTLADKIQPKKRAKTPVKKLSSYEPNWWRINSAVVAQ